MMESSTHNTNGRHHDRGDLAQIRGIGAIRKRWLRSLGIDTIAALAQASADAIEAQAKRDGRTLSRDDLEDWIAQAQVHSVQAPLAQTAQHTVEVRSQPSAPKSSARQPGLEREQPDGWDAIASFKVDYQRRQVNGQSEQRVVTYHLEADTVEHWTAFELDQMQQWMRDRVEASLPTLRTEAPIVVEITQLRVMQSRQLGQRMVANHSSPIFPDAIQTTEPFALEVSMHFAGLTAAIHQTKVAYRVQCFARNLATGITDSLGEMTAQVAPSTNAIYNVLLPSLLLQQPGTYRLKVLVSLQHAPATLGQFKVPMLHAV